MEKAKVLTAFLLRVVAAVLFIHAGGMKLFSWFGGMPDGMKAVFPSEVWFGGVLEFFGGLLILVGLCTRLVAFILAGEMAVAYFQFHQPQGLFPIQNHGEMAVLLCFVFLFFAAHGAGPWSLDGAMRRRRG